MSALDCQTCGACCVGNLDADSYVHLIPADLLALPPEYRSKVVRSRGILKFALATKKDRAGLDVCCALDGVVGDRVSCSVYAARPKLCRDFEPGSQTCMAARYDVGLAEDCVCGKLRDVGGVCDSCGDSRFDPGDSDAIERSDRCALEMKEPW